MRIILLSGGSGTRLWPLSTESRPKQFLKIFKTEDGTAESMIQRMYRMIQEVDPGASVTVATSRNQLTLIREHLGNDVSISLEPCQRNTFPAIALACAMLAKNGVSRNEVMVVCPVDPCVDSQYFECLKHLFQVASDKSSRLTLMGVEPDYPSTEYGYIIPETSEPVSVVKAFKEKPDTQTAQKFIDQGGLWNGGVFAFRLQYILTIAAQEFGSCDYDYLYTHFAELKAISFDYAVVERETEIRVVRFRGMWKDLGLWSSLLEELNRETLGRASVFACSNTHVINELPIPVKVMGLHNAIVAVTPNGILVAEKGISSRVKECTAIDQTSDELSWDFV